jgi:hypothetical protein
VNAPVATLLTDDWRTTTRTKDEGEGRGRRLRGPGAGGRAKGEAPVPGCGRAVCVVRSPLQKLPPQGPGPRCPPVSRCGIQCAAFSFFLSVAAALICGRRPGARGGGRGAPCSAQLASAELHPPQGMVWESPPPSGISAQCPPVIHFCTGRG